MSNTMVPDGFLLDGSGFLYREFTAVVGVDGSLQVESPVQPTGFVRRIIGMVPDGGEAVRVTYRDQQVSVTA